MINLSDLSLDQQTLQARERDAAAPLKPRTHASGQAVSYASEVPPDSVLARSLYHLWRGDPVVIVDSPPGAGKTSLVVTLADLLTRGKQFEVVLACPTINACESLARRLGSVMPGAVALKGAAFKRPIRGALIPAERHKGDEDTVRVTIRTVASCRIAPPECDILIFDEAYQTTFADAAVAADRALQVLMVGDPGQIGPVTTIPTTFWDRHRLAPHHRSPEGFSVARPEHTRLNLPTTYRLGQDTATAIAGLYDFPFFSSRPPAAVTGRSEIETLYVPVSTQVADEATMRLIAEQVQSLVGSTIETAKATLTLGQEDVAVLAARNEQTTRIAALLSRSGLGEVTVGTADRLQGGQWGAVVALDPFFGAEVGSSHSRSIGRLCVMASRHFGHLTWVTSPDWAQVVEATKMERRESEQHRQVRLAFATHTSAASLTPAPAPPQPTANPWSVAAGEAGDAF